MIWFLLHREGVPTQQGNAATAVEALLQGGEMGNVVIISSPISDLSKVYVGDGVVQVRPQPAISLSKTQIMADGVDAAQISNLPANCSLLVDGVAVPVSGGTATLKSRVARVYSLRVEAWPALPWSATVTAKAP
ncbi:hypothetical protein E3C22_16730 [Jiella endophytica]|uniref:Uncharacterized protein n=1 Tax=Jiella endophytica TaxID=2558362 RepID=A0A4Y8RFR1_9HYPH|nr:hypothetical protein [Jiella endophytica]TFF20553.1 hypothetical protein E3C22_16730 [Jiella endophytica]